jgi:hypothetical protein
MSEDVETATTWQSDPRFRYLVPVAVLLGLILLILALAASCNDRNSNQGLKPFRPSRTPNAQGGGGEVQSVSFVDLNSNPADYRNQRIRVTGDKMSVPPKDCRLFTGPTITWGLIAEDLQLNSLGYDKLVTRLPDGLTMTVEGIWRMYDGPLGCGKEPADGVLWYLQVERIISPNPLPFAEGTPFATSQVLLGTRPAVALTPFDRTETPTPETAVTDSPGIGITALPTGTNFPIGTQLPPTTPTLMPTFTPSTGFSTATLIPGLTPSATPRPGSTVTSLPGTGTVTITPASSPSPTASGLITQTPAPTSTGYPGPGPSTPIPTSTPYPSN